MLVSDFDELWQARPFRPFTVHSSDGRSVLVQSPEFAWHAPVSRIICVAESAGESRVRMIDLHVVTSLKVDRVNGLPSTAPDDFPEVPPGPDER